MKNNILNKISIGLSIVLILFLIFIFIKIENVKAAYDTTQEKTTELNSKLTKLDNEHKALKDKYTKALANQKRIFLTFDDGPSANTNKIIEILKKEKVKATFFVIDHDNDKDYQKIINSGNQIALHTFKHDYGMYTSADKFMADLRKIQERVKKATGKDVKVFRFAGGSSNGYVSSATLNKIFAKLKAEGFIYQDWNCDNGDATAITVDKNKLVKNATSCGTPKVINLLMHDAPAKTTTVEALPAVIKYYRDRGYVFDVLDEDSPLVQHVTAK